MTSNRSGATLTEVLMSVLIMSIGVSSVATLFPISVKRSVIATQLTNGTILRNNADAWVNSFPDTIHDPDGDRNHLEHYGGVLTLDSTGNYSRPQSPGNTHLKNGRYIIDPLGFLNTDFSLDGFSGASQADIAKLKSTFGNTGTATLGIPRFSLSSGIDWSNPSNAPTFARRISDATAIAPNFRLPDSWVTEYEGLATLTFNNNNYGVSFTLDPDEGVSASEALEIFNYGDPTRFVIHDRSLFQGEVRTWTSGTASQVSHTNGVFTLAANSLLPANGRFESTAQVRLQRLEDRYSWFLTVRKSTLQHASVDVVVAFRRSYLYQDELAFDAIIQSRTASGDLNKVITGVDLLQYDALLDGQPETSRGQFVMDIENARWYRIQSVDEQANGTFNITDDTPLVNDGAANPQTGLGHIMFFPRVIDVFPLGTKAMKGF